MPLSRRLLIKSLVLGGAAAGVTLLPAPVTLPQSPTLPLPAVGPGLAAAQEVGDEVMRAATVSITASQQSQSVIDRVKDGNVWTAWATSYDSSQESAWLKIDLGQVQPLGRIKWLTLTPDYCRDFDIEISEDDDAYQFLPGCRSRDMGSGTTETWDEIYCGVAARYIKFSWRNKTRTTAVKLGDIAEIQVYKP